MRYCVLIFCAAAALAQTVPPEQAIRTLLDAGSYREAEPKVRALLADSETRNGKESAEVALALDLLVETLTMPGGTMNPDIRGLAARVIALREKLNGPESRELADTLNAAASLYWSRREPVPSLPLAQRAVTIYESSLKGIPNYEREYANTLQSLASAQRENDDFKASRDNFAKAFALYEKSGNAEIREAGTCLNNLASMQANLMDFAGATESYARALVIEEKTLGPEHPYVGFTMNNMGALLARQGKFAEAVPLLTRSLKLTEKRFGPDAPRTGTALVQLANVLAHVGKYDEAWPLFVRAKDIYSRSPGENTLTFAGFMAAYSQAYAVAGKSTEAIEAAARAETIVRDYYATAMRGLPEREALLHAAARANTNRANGLNVLLSLAATRGSAGGGTAMDQLIRSRANVFDEMAARHRASDDTGDPAFEALAAALGQARQGLAALVVRGKGSASTEAYAAELRQAGLEKDEAERKLAAHSARFRVLLAESRIGLADVSAALPQGSVLVSFVRYVHSEYLWNVPALNPGEVPAWSYLAFVLHPGEANPSVVPLGSSKEIGELVRAVREKVAEEANNPGLAPKRSERLYRDAAARLRQKIWDPLIPFVKGAPRVFIVADGELNLANFAALPEGANEYLIETGPMIHYLSTERDLLAPAPAGPQSEGLLAIGNPAFDRRPEALAATLRGGANCSAFQDMRFDRLPASAREVADVAAQWKVSGSGEVLALTGASASKEAFRLQAGHKRVLHLASHGFFLDSGCRPEGATASNPLLLSGIVLAGANASRANGILTAEEIAGMNLDGVDWAVLSACDTALGQYLPGEGVFGLRRAFQQAGARTVIMSLWPADDAVTRAWMHVLYQGRFAGHLDTAKSVQQASLSLLRARRKAGDSTHPLYWGGFIATGAWK
ncbi:MAG TPA: CHAT domain-containing tetratricopeptide repeat protein [Bryobacteraceae bacterium]